MPFKSYQVPYPLTPLLYIGQHKEHDVFYYSLNTHELDSLPNVNWICLGIANNEFNKEFFEEFVYYVATSGLLEFKSQGKYGELLHDYFDEIITIMDVDGGIKTDIMTSWFNDAPNDLANAFWGCFYANVLPEGTDEAKTKLVCIGFDGQDYSNVLTVLLGRINGGWIPPDE